MNSKRIAILQSNYIPWKGYFDLINSVDVFVIYDEVQYTKNDWRNRNLIKTRNGKEWITIPVRQRSLSQRIDETRVTLTNWNVKHWNTIKTNYARASSFTEVRDFLEDLYLAGAMSPNLSEINKRFIFAICSFLNIKTEILDSKEMALKGDRNEKLVEACVKLNGNIYVSGPAAQAYLDVQLFKDRKIEVEWMNYSGYPEYNQLFPPFEHGITVLDVLLNTGRSAAKFVKKSVA